jgi:hypothetical protein
MSSFEESSESDFERTGVALFKHICRIRKKDPLLSRDGDPFNMSLYDEGDWLCLSTHAILLEWLGLQPAQNDMGIVPIETLYREIGVVDLKADRKTMDPQQKVTEDMILLNGTLFVFPQHVNHVGFLFPKIRFAIFHIVQKLEFKVLCSVLCAAMSPHEVVFDTESLPQQ